MRSHIKTLSRARRACSFYHVDLHVHSPSSSDYRGSTEVSPYDFTREFVSRGVDVIAITDHNTGAYIDAAMEASAQIESDVGKKITILPGVELSVSPGIHLLAILPEGGTAAISDLLSRLGLANQYHGDQNRLITQSIDEITMVVKERKGMLLGAHCNSAHGVVQCLGGQTRKDWINAIDALEVNSASDDAIIDRTVKYVTNDLQLPKPFTFGSDSHDCEGDTTGMWVKMADPSLRSLLQLTFEPGLRVRRTKPEAPSHSRIVGFTTTHGVYPEERFRFSPHLNVLLGGRGAGKSAAIDLLRFAFEAEPRESNVVEEVFADRIVGFLQSVGEVCVVVSGLDGHTYVLVRSGAYEKPNVRSCPVFTDRCEVYQAAGDSLIRREVKPLDILPIEFYGQGEVARLADHVDEQLRLIDENIDNEDLVSSIANLEEELSAGEESLIEANDRLEELQAQAAAQPDLTARRNRLSESLADPVFSERTRWDRERAWIEGYQIWLEEAVDGFPESIEPHTEVPLDLDTSTAREILEKVRNTSARVLQDALSNLGKLRASLREAVVEIGHYRDEWNSAFESAEESFRSRLAELGAQDLADAAAELRGVEQRLMRIETITIPKIEETESKISSLNSSRARHLCELRENRSALARMRSAFVDELNSRLGGTVDVDLSGVNQSQYFASVNSPLQGSRMLNRVDQISVLCASTSPDEFVRMIRESSVDELTRIGITDNNARRMIRTLTEASLYKIERVDVPQLPNIRIKREGADEFTNLSLLSVGEKCSAILSIALVSKGRPLVIDQPEDDLDHAFIINSIVEGVRTAKSGRQIIAATHNPNIPVLGDAEMVFRVARLPGADVCHIQNSGGLELPRVTEEVQSLEGGSEAFERRRRRYEGSS